MEASQDYTVAIGVSDITNGVGLPTNYVQAIDLIIPSEEDKYIPYKEVVSVDKEATDEKYWYKYANTIRISPVPTSAYTLTLRYYKKPTELSADAGVPEVPSEFEEALVVGAAYRVMQVKDNYDQAGVLQNKYDEILQKMVMKYSQVQTGQPTIMRINRRGMGKAHF